MRIYQYIVIVALVLLASSCQKDIIESTQIELTPIPIETKQSTVIGLVVNEEGEAIPDVEISFRASNYQTDENGYFKIAETQADVNGGLLKFSKSGFFKNYKFFYPELRETAFVRVELIKEKNVGSFEASDGGSISFNGVSISFPAASIVDEAEENYTGSVTVLGHWFDPSDHKLEAQMPGDLRGVDLLNNPVQLATYGMIAIELRGENNQKLQLAPNSIAECEIPVPEALLSNAPEDIPIWHLDELSAYWKEQGEARLEDNKYKFGVSHFSFWNCDAPYPLINITGRIISENDAPLKFTEVNIKDLDRATVGFGWTNDNGRFQGKVPQDTPLELTILDECNEQLLKLDIGPFSEDKDLGEINIELPNPIQISGNLVCEGEVVSNGYALITLLEGKQLSVPVDEEGKFDLLINNCQASEITVQGIDVDTPSKSDEIINTDPASPLILNNIETCSELEEYIIYKIDGNQKIMMNPSARIIGGRLELSGMEPNSDESIDIRIPNAKLGFNIASRISAYLSSNNVFFAVACFDSDNGCDDVEFDIDILEELGGLTMGTFNGEITDTIGNDPKNFMGEFRVTIDEIREEHSFSGTLWLDENADGLNNDPFNQIVAGIRISLLSSSNSSLINATNTDDQGFYSFEDIPSGEYVIRASQPAGISFTDQVIGNSGMPDSSVDPQTGVTEVIEANGAITDINIGLKVSEELECEFEIISFPSCGLNSGEIVISSNSSNTTQLTFQIFVNGFQTTNEVVTGSEIFLGGLSASEISYIIESDDGRRCEGEFFLDEIEQLTCSLNYELGCDVEPFAILSWDCTNNQGPLTYQWDNGSQEESLFVFTEGSYSCTVTDINGCSIEDVLEVELSGFVSISGYTWIENETGIADQFDRDLEEGLVDFQVYLFEEDNPDEIFAETSTDDFGYYQFLDIPEGSYYIEFEITDNLEFVEKDKSGTINDSDVNPESGLTDLFSIDTCDNLENINAGYRAP